MKWKAKIIAVVVALLVVVLVVFAVYMCMPDTTYHYDNQTRQNYSREDFYTEYLDLVIEKQNTEETDENTEILSNSVVNIINGNNVILNFDDLTPLAMQIAQHFKNDAGQYDYVQGEEGGYSWYGDAPITIGDKSVPNTSSSHRDCSCLVSLMCYFTGIDSVYTHRSSGKYAETFPVVNAETFESARVGDIISTDAKGHVEMIVKVDTDKVYFANAGSTDAITKTAAQGYAYSYAKTKKISEWHAGPNCHLRRASTFAISQAASNQTNSAPSSGASGFSANQNLGGVSYDIYEPSNASTTTPVIFAFHGKSASNLELDSNTFALRALVNNGKLKPNAYIIFPRKGDGAWDATKYSAFMKSFVSNKGLTGSVYYYGFSMAAYDAPEIINACGSGFIKAAALIDGDPFSGNVNLQINDYLGLKGIYIVEAYENRVTGANDSKLSGFTGTLKVDDFSHVKSHVWANGYAAASSGSDCNCSPWNCDSAGDAVGWLLQQ